MSHRQRARPSQNNAPNNINTTVPRKPSPMLSKGRIDTTYSQRNPIPIPTAPYTTSPPPPASVESKPFHTRQSSLPRSISGTSNSRLDAIASSRQEAKGGLTRKVSDHRRSPSEDVPLIFDSSSRSPRYANQVSSSQMSKIPLSVLDSEKDTVLGIAMPNNHKNRNKPQPLPPQLIPELQALANHSASKRQQAPSISTISSPSTRFTESPAPWSASTTTTTPISWPSTSPGIVTGASSNIPSKRFHTVPQPTPTRTRMPKLPQTVEVPKLKAQPTPSSSVTQTGEERRIRRKKGTILDSPAPSPPPRTSSNQRRTKTTGSPNTSSGIDETLARAGASNTPAQQVDTNVDLSRVEQNMETIEDTFASNSTDMAHQHLQESLQLPPTRPSRDGTLDLGESRPSVMNKHKAGFSTQHRMLLDSAFDGSGSEPQDHEARAATIDEKSSTRVQRSPSRLGKLSKLGIFGRRGNSSSDLEKSPKKLIRRGPTAGTGHEGYGKYAPKPRKHSSETDSAPSDSERSVVSSRRPATSRRNVSTSSRAPRRPSQSDLDDFASSRLKPVVIRGGSRTSVDSDKDSVTSQRQGEQVYVSQSRTISPTSSQETQIRLRSPLKDVSNIRGLPTAPNDQVAPLALRRSQKHGSSPESFRMPSPIRTDGSASQPLISSYDTTQSSVVPASLATSNAASDHSTSNAVTTVVGEKKSRRRWWNPFKSKQITEAPRPTKISQPVKPEMAVSFRTGPAPRSVPYYAVMESDSENTGPEFMGDLLAQVVDSRPQTPEPEHRVEENPPVLRNTDSVLLPAAPVWTEPELPDQMIDAQEEAEALQPSAKQPRLAQVGRIPKVVPRSEREHKPSRRSFSQPFNKPTRQFDQPAYVDVEEEPRSQRPQLEIQTDVLPSRPFPRLENLSAKPVSAPARTNPPSSRAINLENADFAKFPSRHPSDVSASSSSEGKVSIMGPPLIPTRSQQEMLRQFPAVRQLSMLHGDDEVWGEYDDFIDHVMSPSKSPERKRTDSPPLRVPTQMSPALDLAPPSLQWKNKPSVPQPRKAVLDLSLPTSLTPPVIFPSPSLLSDRSIGEEIRLRRSRIVSALHSSMDPSSPFSMREFLKDYSPVTRDSMGLSERLSTSTAGNAGQQTPIRTSFPEQIIEAEHSHQESAMLIDVMQREKDPAKQSEMHYASLEVARWLSFGRVLFSPAHKEIHILPERRVLVIDGLGNEDWAIYCAVTYESEKAIIFDLKEASHHRSNDGNVDSTSLPPNYRRKQISSLSERFPFHSAYFSAVVLRFPPAMAESTMKNIIAECRRTLVPGGHLEIMLLDLDIVNMGVQTRRAVRELKMRITTKNPNVSLKPAIDNIQTLLGGRGFGGLNRCVVGVPVAGRPNGSIDSSSSSRSSYGSYAKHASGDTAITQRSGGRTTHDPSHNFSLNDLVADHSENADAKIGRMVSRTARSWWQHCFEASVLPHGDLSRSIFSEKKVLSECKSRASSFKLLIAYAQRPVFETKRRTMSESSAAVSATASAQRQNKASA